MKGDRRFNGEFSEEFFKDLEYLKNELGLPTNKEALERSVAMLKFVVQELSGGSRLMMENGEKREEIIVVI